VNLREEIDDLNQQILVLKDQLLKLYAKRRHFKAKLDDLERPEKNQAHKDAAKREREKRMIDRENLAMQLRQHGFTIREIGKHLEVSAGRADQILGRAQRRIASEKATRNFTGTT
jgi:DNA-directed RNA polymerase specialized sigma24 family protein